MLFLLNSYQAGRAHLDDNIGLPLRRRLNDDRLGIRESALAVLEPAIDQEHGLLRQCLGVIDLNRPRPFSLPERVAFARIGVLPVHLTGLPAQGI